MDHRHLVFLRPAVNVGDVGIPIFPNAADDGMT